MKILITGASGFIGGYIVDEALSKGLEVYAAIRKTSSRKYLQDERIKFIEVDFSNEETLTQQLIEFRRDHGNLNYVVHNAGVTKTTNTADFETVNFGYTKNFISALNQSGHKLDKFVFMSTLAASGPGPEDGSPMMSSHTPMPIDAYGTSKFKAEEFIKDSKNLPYIILRPTGVFGPRDADMFSFFELINKKLELYIGVNKQFLSLIYVKDMARAVISSCLSNLSGNTYFISDGNKYDNVIFSNVIKKSLGKRTIVIKLPLFLVYIVAFFAQQVGKVTGKPSPLNLEKVKILKATNWFCDASPFERDMNFKAEYSLEGAIDETIQWYKKENWL